MAEFSEFSIKLLSDSGQDICIDTIEIENETLFAYCQESYDPEVVFGEDLLSEWAKSNGFVKEEE